MCLLLTLLAVPVFYSLFDDAQESHVWRSVSGRFSWLGERFRPLTSKISEAFSLFRRRKNRPDKKQVVNDEFSERKSSD
jgi:hypothetical protein